MLRNFLAVVIIMAFLTGGCASMCKKHEKKDSTHSDSTHIKGEQEVIVKEEVVVE